MTPRRFDASFPCPICEGHQRLARGKGVRCSGFLSSDKRYAHCSREEYPGGLEPEQNGTYAHRVDGPCRCGVTHGEPEHCNGADRPRRIVKAYPYVDEDGRELFEGAAGSRRTLRRPASSPTGGEYRSLAA